MTENPVREQFSNTKQNAVHTQITSVDLQYALLMTTEPKTLTEDELNQILENILERPLYTRLVYAGAARDVEMLRSPVKHYCPNQKCRQVQLWERLSKGEVRQKTVNTGLGPMSNDYPTFKVGLTNAIYQCRNCKETAITVYIRWTTLTKLGACVFEKVGQYPPIEERIDSDLEKELESDDLKNYKTAIRCRNFGMGLAACGYIRRVIEDRVNGLLDLIIDVDKTSGQSPNVDKLEEIKRSRMSDRLDFAKTILPDRLKPSGRNPLDGLYAVVSDGIHAKSEEECLQIFDEAKIGFEYLFKKLRSELNESEAYVKALDAIEKRQKRT